MFIENIVVQSTLLISKSKGLLEILRDIHTSTYQICGIEDKINRKKKKKTHFTNEYVN